MKTALLIIDVQQALSHGEHAAWDIPRVLANINVVSAQARAAGAPVFLVQHDAPGSPLHVRIPLPEQYNGALLARLIPAEVA